MKKHKEIFFRFENGKIQKVLLSKDKQVLPFFERLQKAAKQRIYLQT